MASLGNDNFIQKQHEKELLVLKQHMYSYKVHQKIFIKWVDKMDSLNKSLIPNRVTGYRFVHQCRLKIPSGGQMLKSFDVISDTTYKIISFTETNYP